MSNLYKKYLSLKIDDSSTFYLFENGIFYIFLSEDAEVMSQVLHLKLTNLNSFVYKYGFPASHLEKYLSLLNTMNYPIKIVNSDSYLAYSQKDYFTNCKIKDFMKKVSHLQPDILSISQSYEVLNDLSREADFLIKEIEKEKPN